MNSLLKDRVKLIRAMQKASLCLSSSNFDQDIVNEIISKIRANFKDHFLSVSQEAPMQISYCRNVEDKYNNIRRVRTPLGRYISRNLESNINHHMLDVFVGQTWAFYSGKTINVEIFKGHQIMKKYKEFDNTSDSCMTGDYSYLTKFYAINPDKVSLVCYEGIRALLWTCDSGEKILDRCYPAGNQKLHVLRAWAVSKGFLVRENADRLCETSLVRISNNKTYNVTTKPTDEYPYLDTFCFGSFVDIKAKNGRMMHRLVLSNNSSNKEFRFQSTDGSYFENYDYDDDDDNDYDDDDDDDDNDNDVVVVA